MAASRSERRDSPPTTSSAATSPAPVLIIGAGINGAAIARELAVNGVDVCLVDAADVASGATAYSSRLIHGGLRYLEYGEFDLVRESLAERRRLLRLAPHLVRPLELAIPVAKRLGGFWPAVLRFLSGGRWGNPKPPPARGLWLVRIGLWLYDRYAADASMPPHSVRRIADGVADVKGKSVDANVFRWLCSYWDAQVEFPERFTFELLEDARRAAAANGTRFDVHTYHRVTRRGRAYLLCATKSSTPASPLTIEPALVINATGASVDRALAQLKVPTKPLMGPTKGSHFITRHVALRSALGRCGVYAEAADGRPVFVLPHGDAVLVGTTDIPYSDAPESAVASDEELAYLVDTVNRLFANVRLARSDIDFHYSGVRPLPRSDADSTAGVTRRHWIDEADAEGVPILSVIGGKLTTCRALAESVADHVLAKIGRARVASTQERPLPGAAYYPPSSDEVTREQRRIAEQTNLPLPMISCAWRLWGMRAADVMAECLSIDADRTPLDQTDLPAGAARRSIRHEWARTLNDLVERRLMLLYHRPLTRSCLRQLATILAAEGLLAPHELEAEVDRTVNRLWAHFGKQVAND